MSLGFARRRPGMNGSSPAGSPAHLLRHYQQQQQQQQPPGVTVSSSHTSPSSVPWSSPSKSQSPRDKPRRTMKRASSSFLGHLGPLLVAAFALIAFLVVCSSLLLLHPSNVGSSGPASRRNSNRNHDVVVSFANPPTDAPEQIRPDNVEDNVGPTTTTMSGLRSSASQNHHHHHHHDGVVVVVHDDDTDAPPSNLIPHILIFTHRFNLLEPLPDDNFEQQPQQQQQSLYSSKEERDELIVLQRNVRNITTMHPDATVRFLTDDDCAASIRRVMTVSSIVHHNAAAEHDQSTTADRLVHYFHTEQQGMYKADLCRGAALYETGGIYLDVDLGVRQDLWAALQDTTEFATVRVHRQSKYPGAFFQAFVAVAPQHPVLYRYVELFLQHYEGTLSGGLEEPKGPLGVLLLKRAYDEIEQEQRDALLDQDVVSEKEDTVPAPRTTTTITHLNATTELWQEALYRPELQHTILSHVPPPTWGTRRACKFVVLTAPTLPLVVPLYSRIAGSRMCPIHTGNGGNTDAAALVVESNHTTTTTTTTTTTSGTDQADDEQR